MKTIFVATEAEADALVSSINKAMGYPRNSVHVGEGRHVDMPETWSGRGEPPPGWCPSYAEIHHRAESKEIAIPIDDGDAARLVSRLNLLSEQERAALSDAIDRRTETDLAAEGYAPRRRTVSDTNMRRE